MNDIIDLDRDKDRQTRNRRRGDLWRLAVVAATGAFILSGLVAAPRLSGTASIDRAPGWATVGAAAYAVVGSAPALAAAAVAAVTEPTPGFIGPAIGCLHREIGNINPGWVEWNASNETHYTELFRVTKCGGGYVKFRSDGWRHIGGCGYIWAEYWANSRWNSGPSRFVCDGYSQVVLLSGQPQERQYRLRGFTIQYSAAGEARWFMGAFDS